MKPGEPKLNRIWRRRTQKSQQTRVAKDSRRLPEVLTYMMMGRVEVEGGVDYR